MFRLTYSDGCFITGLAGSIVVSEICLTTTTRCLGTSMLVMLQDLLVTLSTLLRGSIYEKLRWTFKLYDINGDGCITRAELAEIVVAIHELMGRRSHQVYNLTDHSNKRTMMFSS